MKAQEFRLGNLIEFNGLALKITELKDSSISTQEFTYLPPFGYHPIPLTKEWLLKFGFQKGGNTMLISLYEARGNFFFSHDCGMSKIQYVHQLQNLYFALTGEELILKP